MELAEVAVQRWQNHEVLAALHGIEPRHIHQWPRSSSCALASGTFASVAFWYIIIIIVPARSCLACRLAVDLEVCRAVVCRIAGRRVHHSPQAAAPAATPSAQRVGSASCMSRCRPIRASCFAAGASHPAPGLRRQSHGRHPILEKAW